MFNAWNSFPEVFRRVRCKCKNDPDTGPCYACEKLGAVLHDLDKKGWIDNECLYYKSRFHRERLTLKYSPNCHKKVADYIQDDLLYTPQFSCLPLCEKHLEKVNQMMEFEKRAKAKSRKYV
jgi:hypothetical protein